MRLGLDLGHLTESDGRAHVALALEAERLGYDVCWAAEAYGSDAPTVLAFIAARTERIGLGTAAMQIPARTPAMTAMTAATLDVLSQGRFRLGLGVSGPQVSEGWHGVRFDQPIERTREYVDIVRMALARQPVAYQGRHHVLPLPDGPGKALKLTLRPPRELPLYLAAMGPRNLELAGEIAAGWLGIFFSPERSAVALDPLRAGAERAGRQVGELDVSVSVPVVVDDRLDACADALRGYTALYVGGMGSREQNFYQALARRMGFEPAARRVQELYLDGHVREAMAAVPFELIDQTSLLGPPARITDRLHAYAEAGVTTLVVAPTGQSLDRRTASLRTVAEALAASGLGE